MYEKRTEYTCWRPLRMNCMYFVLFCSPMTSRTELNIVRSIYAILRMSAVVVVDVMWIKKVKPQPMIFAKEKKKRKNMCQIECILRIRSIEISTAWKHRMNVDNVVNTTMIRHISFTFRYIYCQKSNTNEMDEWMNEIARSNEFSIQIL